MQQIGVDFEVWKELTARRQSEAHTYNQVLRDLLGLADRAPSATDEAQPTSRGRLLGGRFLPDGTLLRAKYKGAWHHAQIHAGELVGQAGEKFNSASAAARAVTDTNVNGLTFWDVQRPGQSGWETLASIERQK